MEHKEREDRRRVAAGRQTGTDSGSAWNGTKRKELTNEWNQTKGGEVLDRGMRGHLFFSAHPFPSLLIPRENVCVSLLPRQICGAFIRTQRWDVPGTGRREGAGRGTTCICVRGSGCEREALAHLPGRVRCLRCPT